MAMDGFVQAKKITKKHAKTFHFASSFLDKNKRNAAYAVYAICRLSDEAVDHIASTYSQSKITQLKERVDSVYANSVPDDSILSAFQKTVRQYRIPRQYFNELIQGMEMDLEKSRYANFDELYDYCYKVAGVVGLIMLKIFGYNKPETEGYAVNLGIAMQLTNILRDIKEDFGRGRIYLPYDEIESYRITEADIRQEKISSNFKALMDFQIKRARQYYKDSTAGIRMITDPNSRFVVYTMKNMYAGILDEIENNQYDVYSRRAHVNTLKKLIITLKILLKGQYL